jgi:putative transposase
VGDAWENALTETINGLFKTKVVRRRGPLKGLDEVEYATLEWAYWFNTERLLEPIGYVSPLESEKAYNDGYDGLAVGAEPN